MSSLCNETGRSLGDFSDDWWDETIDRLSRYADIKLHKRKWLGIRGGDPPGGVEGRDIVQVVLEKVFSGERKWDADVHPDLRCFLKSQVDSEISNLVTSAPNRKTTRVSADGESPEAGRYWSENLRQNVSPEDEVIEREASAWFWGFVEALESEGDLQEVVLAVLEGATKRRDIAAMLDISESEVDNRRKRLVRRRRDYVHRRQKDRAVQEGGVRRG